MIRVEVECYAGYRGEETPRRLRLGGRTLEIAEVIDRWLAPDHRYFKVRTESGAIYILRHDEERSEWEVAVFEASAR